MCLLISAANVYYFPMNTSHLYYILWCTGTVAWKTTQYFLGKIQPTSLLSLPLILLLATVPVLHNFDPASSKIPCTAILGSQSDTLYHLPLAEMVAGSNPFWNDGLRAMFYLYTLPRYEFPLHWNSLCAHLLANKQIGISVHCPCLAHNGKATKHGICSSSEYNILHEHPWKMPCKSNDHLRIDLNVISATANGMLVYFEHWEAPKLPLPQGRHKLT